MPQRFYEIFRAGNYPQGNFDAEDIREIAENYDASFLEAPVTVDHQWGGPAYGWIAELKAEGERLLATFKDISDHLKCMVATKSYKRHSVEIYNDVDDRGPYLKALSMLGASTPQVKGMETIEFSAFSENFPENDSQSIEFEEPIDPGEMAVSEFLAAWLDILDIHVGEFRRQCKIDEDTAAGLIEGRFDEQVDGGLVGQFESVFESIRDDDVSDDMLAGLREALATAGIADTAAGDEPEISTDEFAQMQQRVQTLEDELQTARNEKDTFADENEQIKFDQRRDDFVSFLDTNIKDKTKLPPKLKDKAVSLFEYLDGVQPADEDAPSPLDIFKEIIEGLPEIDFDELALKVKQPEKFTDPHKLAAAATKYQHEQKELGNNITLGQAISHIKNQNND